MKGAKNRNRRGGLADEDRALWELVASSVEPVRGKNRVPDVEIPEIDDQTHPADAGFHPAPSPSRGGQTREGRTTKSPSPSSGRSGSGSGSGSEGRGGSAEASQLPKRRAPSPPDPQPAALDRKRARRVARGAEEIEARLDLHGMTQDDAHHALTGFVWRCHAQGLRFVLVITGKGGAGSSDRSGRQAGYADDDGSFVARPRGVLRRNVPRWLGSPELAPMVVSYTTAHIRHGGEGALYVQLRVKR